MRQMRCTRSTAQERPLLPGRARRCVAIACTSAAIARSVVSDCSRSASVRPRGKPSSSTPADAGHGPSAEVLRTAGHLYGQDNTTEELLVPLKGAVYDEQE